MTICMLHSHVLLGKRAGEVKKCQVNSIASQADAIGEVAGGPAIGVIGTVGSLRAALVATGLLLTPAIPLFLRALRHGGREPELEEAEAPA